VVPARMSPSLHSVSSRQRSRDARADNDAPTGSRVHRNVLVGLRRLWRRRFRRQSTEGSSVGIGFLGVALAFGLTVLTGVYAFGTISGGHFNPAVTLGAALARRVEWKAVPGYWITQVVAGIGAGMMIYVIAKGKEGWTATGHMAANGFGEHSPGGYALWAVIVAEVVLTGSSCWSSLGQPTTARQKGSRAWRLA
jgi:glycerol uptake facilitator-like aquaporin